MKFYIKKNSGYRTFRDQLITEFCKGKKVLHIGATDAPFTEIKLERGLLLHQHLNQVTQELLGIDIDEEAIEYLKSCGLNNIIHFDMNNLKKLDFKPDVIIFGETIEHLMNLEIALSNLKQVMSDSTSLIVSTPNALWIDKIIHTMIHKEFQHPDHKLVFSFGTLTNLFEANGLGVDKVYYTFLNRRKDGVRKKLKKLFCRIFPGFSETLLFIVSKTSP